MPPLPEHRRSAAPLAPSGGFAWRSPLLPVDELRAWSEGLRAPAVLANAGDHNTSEDLDAALTADRRLLRERLATAVNRPELRDALAVSAPRVETGIPNWVNDPHDKRGQGLERSLVRYFTRATTRPTPFGLLAGASTGTTATSTATDTATTRERQTTRLNLAPREEYRRYSQVDTDVLYSLGDHLAGKRALRRHLRFVANDSVYRALGQFRFAQATLDGTRRRYRVAGIPDRNVVRHLLDRAGTAGGATFEDLVTILVDAGHERRASEQTVHRLIDRQLLVGAVGLRVVDDAPLRHLIEQLECFESTSDIGKRLRKIHEQLVAMDAAGLGATPAQHRAITDAVAELPLDPEGAGAGGIAPEPGPGVPRRRKPGEAAADPLHVVLVKPAVAHLNSRVVTAMQQAVDVLHATSRAPQDSPLASFAEAMAARFDTHEVPLTTALDREVGVGYGGGSQPTSLLHGVPLPPPPEEDRWTARDTALVEHLGPALQSGAYTVGLDAKALDALRDAVDRAPLPQALSVLGTVLAASPDAVDRGDFRLLVDGAVGPSGARLLGRFCHADAATAEIVANHLRAEEATDPDAVFAEVLHLPPDQQGNVVLRPVLRAAEIGYLGRSGTAPRATIPVTDLRVSVRGGEVVLVSERLGRRIEPRLTSAHNTAISSLPMYRFLSDMQSQGSVGSLAWDWGPLRDLPFLPRVTHGNLVLSRATWRLRAGELDTIRPPVDGAGFAALQRWRDERGLPRHVQVAQGDRRLVVDLDNVLSADSFLQLARRPDQPPLLLQEAFLDDEDLLARGPEGRFTHELILPLVATSTRGVGQLASRNSDRTSGARQPPRHRSRSGEPMTARTFAPGSEWLYAKIYTGWTVADSILTDVLAPLRYRLSEERVIDRWFFLRFGDPQFHLRVRWHGDPSQLATRAVPDLQAALAPLVADGRVTRVCFDTYEREIDALGGPDAIEAMERLFHVDSDAAVEAIGGLPPGAAGLDARWRLALFSMDRALADLGLSLDEQRGLVALLRDNYGREHRADATTKKALGRRFREERATIAPLLADGGDDGCEPSALSEAVDALGRRSVAWVEPIQQLRALRDDGRLTVPWTHIAERVLHLQTNRLLSWDIRPQEMVLYDFLARVIDSRIARRSPRGST